MHDPQADGILRRLRSPDPRDGWAAFLDAYSPLLLAVIRLFERDEDSVGDCYLFACEQLSRNRFRRLLRFRVDGPASFTTWLRAVCRNLCVDWHRQEFGRHRVFESISRLPTLDQEIFTRVLVDGLSAEDAYLALHPRFPGLTADGIAQGIRRVQTALTPRQQWLLAVRRGRSAQSGVRQTEDPDELLSKTPTDAPDPEEWTALREEREVLVAGLARLSARDRLLIKLRFERELTLEEMAGLLHLGNAQQADRHVRRAVENLRVAIWQTSGGRRKPVRSVRVIQTAESEPTGPFGSDGDG
jgi:RNA polymerase sigma factor (sigma-70 family)